MRAKFAIVLAVASSLLLVNGSASANSTKTDCPSVEIRAASLGQVLVPPGGVTHADVSVTEGQTVLGLNLTPAAAERLRSYTATRTGQSMMVVVDGKVFKSARLRDPIVGKGFVIGPVDRPAAEHLAAAINRCATR